MDHLGARQLPGIDLGRRMPRDATRELGPVHIANAHDVAGFELAFTSRDAGWKQTLARFAQRLARAIIHVKRAAGMMKKGNPAFSPLQLVRLRDEQGAFVFAGDNAREALLFFCPRQSPAERRRE